MILYRSMTESAGGSPAIGPTARLLGVRPGFGGDIYVDSSNEVEPDTGGMSVAPNDPMNLPKHRRPPSLGGTGKDPVWRIDTEKIGARLRFVQDSATHGTIQPATRMPIGEFQQALADTASDWEKVG